MYSVRIFAALGTAVAVTVFWDSPVLLPLKQFVVYIHEVWHAVVSMAAGAKVEKIILYDGESGETLVKELHGHGAFIAAVSAGYLGSVVSGAFLLNRGLMGSGEKITASFSGIFILFITLLLTDPGSSAFLTGLIFGAGLSLLTVTPPSFSRYVLIVLGTAFVWYSIFDMLDFTEDVTRTDAGILTAYLFSKNLLPADESYTAFYSYTISLIWSGLMLLTLWLFIKPVLKAESIKTEPPPAVMPDISPLPEEIQDSDSDPLLLLQESAEPGPQKKP